MAILWTQPAVADLYRVREHIRFENPAAAEKVGAVIETASNNLLRYPEMGRRGEVAGTRELPISGLPYFLVYRLKGDAVQILRVLHGRQKWPVS